MITNTIMQSAFSELLTGITVDAVTIERYERQLFKPVTFDLRPGQLIQIVGANGVGKTTLLRALCGLIAVSEGRICYNGQQLADVPELFQTQLLYIGHKIGAKASLSVVENLEWLQALSQASGVTIMDALAQLQMTHRACHLMTQLSAGQQRRVALARLLLTRATCWILDEPLTALDTYGCQWVEAQIKQHCDSGGMVVMTSHQPLTILIDAVQKISLSSSGCL